MNLNCPACFSLTSGETVSTRSGLLNVCPNCGTVWRKSGAVFEEYGDEYFKTRGHEGMEPAVRDSKIATFRFFYRKAGIPTGAKVLEIGCATGWGLVAARDMGFQVRGLDVAEESQRYAVERGFPPETVVRTLKELGGEKFEAVSFFDALEHIPDPENFLKELHGHLSPGARLLVVIPRADTFSRKILGQLWPHYLADHWVHFSRDGLRKLMDRAGFSPEQNFFPLKWITPFTVAQHLFLHSGLKIPVPARPMFPFNFGEDGCVFVARV